VDTEENLRGNHTEKKRTSKSVHGDAVNRLKKKINQKIEINHWKYEVGCQNKAK